MEEHDYRHAGEARESGRDAQTLVQMNAPKPSANTLVNETGSHKYDEENPGKPALLLRDSGRASFGPLKALHGTVWNVFYMCKKCSCRPQIWPCPERKLCLLI